jgi:YbgC/YbaW family acyl-CoA thioester hydrolase
MKPLPLDRGEFAYTRVVQFAETDLAGIVHFSAYFRYMEEAEHAMWRAAGLSVARDDLHWPRISASCEYASPLRFEDEITVKVRAGFGRRRIQYGFEIRRSDTVAATGAMTSVCTRGAAGGTLKTAEIPQELVERLRGVLR